MTTQMHGDAGTDGVEGADGGPVGRSPALQRLLDDLEAERYRPVPPPPPPTAEELAARARILAVLSGTAGVAS